MLFDDYFAYKIEILQLEIRQEKKKDKVQFSLLIVQEDLIESHAVFTNTVVLSKFPTAILTLSKAYATYECVDLLRKYIICTYGLSVGNKLRGKDIIFRHWLSFNEK